MTSPRAKIQHWLAHQQPDLLRILRLVRYELAMRTSHLLGRLSPGQRIRLRRLRRARGLRIHFASGLHAVQGWIQVDSARGADVRMDLRRRLPFASDSAEFLFAEHFLDHLQYPDNAERFLGECRRVLQPGGRIRIVVHDAEILARKFSEREEAFFHLASNAPLPLAEALNHLFRYNEAHQFLYDFDALRCLLLRAGFDRVLRSGFRLSELEVLNLDLDYPDRSIQSLYVEAVK